jgi:predicted ATPase
MLKSIRLQHFRSFEDEAVAEMAPITLIYGANSAGKSSIIKALLLLKQSYGDGGDDTNTLRFDGPIVDLGSARAAAFGHTFDPPLRISLDFETPTDMDFVLSGSISFEVSSDEAKDDRIEVALDIGENRYRLIFTKVSKNQRFLALDRLSVTDFNAAMKALKERTHEQELFEGTSPGMKSPLFRISNLLPQEIVGRNDGRTRRRPNDLLLSTEEREWNEVVAPLLRKVFESTINRVSYLGPLRKAPNRIELLDRSGGLSGVGKQGEFAFSVLKRDEALLSRVNKSLREHLESPYALELPSWPKDSEGVIRDLLPVSVVPILRHTDSGVAISIADAGFGLSQLLPFLIEMHSREETIICIEQPELHLHPRLQSRMAETLLNSWQGGNRNRFLIETHSEHLLLRIQRMIREKRLKSEDVSILYVDNHLVEHDSSGEIVRRSNSVDSRVIQIRLNRYGDMIDPWPGGFFDERLEELGWSS